MWRGGQIAFLFMDPGSTFVDFDTAQNWATETVVPEGLIIYQYRNQC